DGTARAPKRSATPMHLASCYTPICPLGAVFAFQSQELLQELLFFPLSGEEIFSFVEFVAEFLDLFGEFSMRRRHGAHGWRDSGIGNQTDARLFFPHVIHDAN